MVRGSVQRFKSGRQLLKSLTDNPALPAFIPSLAPISLGHLIKEVGITDSAELIEHTTATQLATVVDNAIWKNPAPGTPEKFDPGEFLNWLEVLLKIGEEFTVERLQAMDEDLLATAMHYFLNVQDVTLIVLEPGQAGQIGAQAPSTADAYKLVGHFAVTPRYIDEWDVVAPALSALDDNEPDFLQALLSRCCMASSLLGSNREITQTELDAAQTHQQRQRREGFVTPERAAMFLTAARDASIEELVETSEYDLDTVDYFNQVARAAKAQQAPSAHNEASPRNDDASSTATAQEDITSADFQELTRTVNSIDLAQTTANLMLTHQGVQNRTRLEQALLHLGETQPEQVSQRLDETTYLSNLLIAGSQLDGKRLDAHDAARLVMATCNLALECYPELIIDTEPGLVGLFRVGWQFIQRLQIATLVAIRQALSALASGDLPIAKRWVMDDVIREVASDQLQADIELRRFEKTHDVLHMLSLVFEPDTCQALRLLLDDIPCLHDNPGQTSPTRRFISTSDDLGAIQTLLHGLVADKN